MISVSLGRNEVQKKKEIRAIRNIFENTSVERVNKIRYVRSIITEDGGTVVDVAARINAPLHFQQ
jgi:transcriptional regulator of NAD metabolism